VKLLGIIGGLGPESTVEYYREIHRQYRERVSDGSAPHFILSSVNMKQVVDAVSSGDLDALADYVVREVNRLADAGAVTAMIAANMPHLAFDNVQSRSRIPLISIVQAACKEASSKGLKRLGLWGTRFTMQARMYPDVFAREGIAILRPNAEEQEFIHDLYFNELVKGLVRDEARDRLLTIAQRMKRDEQIDGVLLGGTELSLIIKSLDGTGLELLDTMKIQVKSAIEQMLSQR
jgi:aspartate racemase